jgi:hypothetical protein
MMQFIKKYFADTADGERVKRDFDRFGFARFVDREGFRALVCHAYSDGELEVKPVDDDDYVICCYPTRAAKRHDVLTAGSWVGKSKILFYTKSVVVVKEGGRS